MTDRALSITVNYVLTIAIVTVLFTTLLGATGDTINDRREEAVRGELRVLGQRTASALMAADRLAAAGGTGISIEVELPGRVAGLSYRIDVDASSSDPHIDLETNDPVIAVRVRFENATAIEDTATGGGDLRIVSASDGDLEVRGA